MNAKPAYDCWTQPLRINVGAPRNLDTRDGPELSPARYKKMHWAVGHTKPPAAAFALSPADAVDAVVALEAKQPALIPEPYRQALLASPRDPALRLQIGACEATDPASRRRAAYEGAMALMLGGAPDQAAQLIVLGTKGSTGSEAAHARISKLEADVETALTRGLIGELTKPRRLTSDARSGWMSYIVHFCGAQLCKLADYEVDNRVELVVWDLRDRGTVEVEHSSDSGQSSVDFRCLDRCQESYRACQATSDVCDAREYACRTTCQ